MPPVFSQHFIRDNLVANKLPLQNVVKITIKQATRQRYLIKRRMAKQDGTPSSSLKIDPLKRIMFPNLFFFLHITYQQTCKWHSIRKYLIKKIQSPVNI